ncbi:lanthionine synthetase C family protein [Nonomuraea sp. NPDC049714]|uniref:lanthionine synthetase C family protein n=1 Tax=Nonomuraea sp. NPDC049714 TaxID=3364357 RepID=UPI0037AD948D
MTDADLLSSATASRARKVAVEILHRLCDRELVVEAGQAASAMVGRPVWEPGAALYAGAAGSALAFAHAARACPDSSDHWWAQAHQWLKLAASSTRERPLRRPGLSLGTTGIALAVAGCDEDDRYARTLRGLDTRLAEQLDRFGPSAGRALIVHDYDVISGLAGILGYACRRPADHVVQRITARGVERLVARCATDGPDGGALITSRWTPWRIAPENYGREGERELYPHGYVDLGLAHGVPGPLAALSRAWLADHRAPGLREAIRALTDQLVAASWQGEHGRTWSRVMPFDASGEVAPHLGQAADPAYCYGAPGITSALLDAAEALGDESVRAVAIEGFEAALLQMEARPRRTGPGLCHGLAGVLLICGKFATRAGSAAARAALERLVDRLLGGCDPSHPLIVRDYKPQMAGEPGSVLAASPDGAWIDHPGLLDGAAGVALALLSVAERVPPRWAHALLAG